MDMISALPEELLHEVSSFLIPREICSFFALLSVELRKVGLNKQLHVSFTICHFYFSP